MITYTKTKKQDSVTTRLDISRVLVIIAVIMSVLAFASCTKAPLLIKTAQKNTTTSVSGLVIANTSNKATKPSITTTYNVMVVLKWKGVPPMMAPVLYDSVKAGSWNVVNLGSPKYNIADTALNITNWFGTYSNDTVQFSLSENGKPWQTVYTSSPTFGKCEVIIYTNNVIKMDTVLSDITTVTLPKIQFIIH